MIKRPRFSKGELLLIAEAVRFYRVFIEESEELLRKNQQQLKSLRLQFQLTNDHNIFDEIQKLKVHLARAEKLRYTKRSWCLRTLERRLSALPEGHRFRSGVMTAALQIDALKPMVDFPCYMEPKTA